MDWQEIAGYIGTALGAALAVLLGRSVYRSGVKEAEEENKPAPRIPTDLVAIGGSLAERYSAEALKGSADRIAAALENINKTMSGTEVRLGEVAETQMTLLRSFSTAMTELAAGLKRWQNEQEKARIEQERREKEAWTHEKEQLVRDLREAERRNREGETDKKAVRVIPDG